MAREFHELPGVIRGITVGSKEVFPAQDQAKARSRSYSEVLYEHGLERSRASRGVTQVWVAVPGARRRVFYFAAVLSSEWLVARSSEGFGVCTCKPRVNKGFPKQVARQLKHEAKTQRKLG